jgi:hypothetical protein
MSIVTVRDGGLYHQTEFDFILRADVGDGDVRLTQVDGDFETELSRETFEDRMSEGKVVLKDPEVVA